MKPGQPSGTSLALLGSPQSRHSTSFVVKLAKNLNKKNPNSLSADPKGEKKKRKEKGKEKRKTFVHNNPRGGDRLCLGLELSDLGDRLLSLGLRLLFLGGLKPQWLGPAP